MKKELIVLAERVDPRELSRDVSSIWEMVLVLFVSYCSRDCLQNYWCSTSYS